MSLETCGAGTSQGFPLPLGQKFSDPWTGITPDVAQKKLKDLTIPTDFSISWGPPSQASKISTSVTKERVQIRGIDTVADSTTMLYGKATYKCSSVISIVKNQHTLLTSTKVSDYEIIMAFQIQNKQESPSSPDIILMCRPLIFSTFNTSPFWASVNTAILKESPQSTVVDLSSIFSYRKSTLMPMISYMICCPVKLLNYKNALSKLGSLKIRVNVTLSPIHVVADTNGLGKCASVNKYTLITEPKRPVDIFEGISANTVLQFKNGLGNDQFPVVTSENLVLQGSSERLIDFDTLTNRIMILVPEDLIGQSLTDLSKAKKPRIEGFTSGEKKALKCYRINSEKDIVNGEIMVDPETGEPLESILNQEAKDSVGGELSLLEGSSGVMPGDVEYISFILLTTLLSFGLFGYLVYIINMFMTGQPNIIYNVIIFIVIFISLITSGILFT